MASLLDISLVGHFSDVFIILFIFTAIYAILLFRGPFGANKGLNALIAFAISMIMAFSKEALTIIADTVPWAVLLLVILMVTLLATKSVGVDLPLSITKNLGTWLLVIMIIVFLINVSMQLGQSAGPYLSNGSINPDYVEAGSPGDVGSGSFAQNFGATLFHPKVLALLLILIIGLFTVFLVGYWA
jgi:hypothetical protein